MLRNVIKLDVRQIFYTHCHTEFRLCMSNQGLLSLYPVGSACAQWKMGREFFLLMSTFTEIYDSYWCNIQSSLETLAIWLFWSYTERHCWTVFFLQSGSNCCCQRSFDFQTSVQTDVHTGQCCRLGSDRREKEHDTWRRQQPWWWRISHRSVFEYMGESVSSNRCELLWNCLAVQF